MVREMENTEMGVTPFSQPGKATGETSEVFQTWGVTVQSEYHHMLWPLQLPDQGLKKKRLLWGSFLDSLAQQHLQFLTLPLVFKCKMSSLRLPYVVSRHQLYLCQQFQNGLQLWRFLSYFTDSPGFITTHSISQVINRVKGTQRLYLAANQRSHPASLYWH